MIEPSLRLTIARPDDAHLHLRDGAMLRAVLPFSARQFGRALIMPNLKPPVTTSAEAAAYRKEIMAALPENADFTPLMTLYLTDATDPDDVEKGARDGIVAAAKLYPAGATTNSAEGVTDIQALAPVFERMQRIGLPLAIHGEVTDPNVDIFDREAVFIDRVLVPLRRHFPALRIVFEHVTTTEGVSYVFSEGQEGTLAATITAHHLRINRNALFAGGLQPHAYCLPVAKREKHRRALVEAATSGASMFFLGTDSAPHPRALKECANGCAGLFTAPAAMALYAETFDEADALDRLEAFASVNAAQFYKLPINKGFLTLEKSAKPREPLKPILTSDGAEIVAFQDATPLFWEVVA
jgi:dihydroorotase